ncbi:hypothetical protein [Schumannella sp. 10F1B-5-1]|uniref:hypothetical protein n=1 Tax=Schumannella sp. 10F1B-5-1 TaxID=2590780 RepID=UPI0011314632|nr:hypothetical protein [Schumannella sp. 10F1B-5-1]TPW78392.1 hypothetical protein FJ658_00875 [Schumannella sp. 10F1B-5-1]
MFESVMVARPGADSRIPINVWTVDGRPSRLVAGAERFTVINSPTPLAEADLILSAGVTHPPTSSAWRFTVRAADGESSVLDVACTPEGWFLLRRWE